LPFRQPTGKAKESRRILEKSSKIFVAGGTGMVGSGLIRKLLAAGCTNIVSNYYSRPPEKALLTGAGLGASAAEADVR
jgi:GDP-L-fucose synthase